jgi:hypothetical protein
MERDEGFNTTAVLIAANNFKASAGLRSSLTGFGRNMSGRGRRSKTSENGTAKARIGSGKPSMILE